MKKDSLGDRMKRYEEVSSIKLTPRTPVIVRLDGRAFHTFTRGFDKPFDKKLMNAMVGAAKKVAEQMQGFKLGYTQSDEVSFLLTDYDNFQTNAWFDNKLQKIITIASSIMTANFNKFINVDKLAYFDGRAFNLPENEIANYFLWRAKDWGRNSIQMYTRSFYSHKELNNKSTEDMHEMLFEKGKNWTTDLTDQEKNGTFLVKEDGKIITKDYILDTYTMINSQIPKLQEEPKDIIRVVL